MKVSRKRPTTMDSQEKSNSNSNKDKAIEEEQQQEEEQHQEQGEEIQEEEQQEEEEEEEEEQQEEEEQEEQPPRLEEGFYEMEAIRKKRVRKAQLQYLIKWRGWPESANTWEPVDNLQACSDVVDAFEERLQKSSRKRKRRGPYSSVGGGAKNRRGSSADPNPCTEMPNRDGPDPGNVVIGEGGEGKEVDDEGKGDEEKKEDDGCISIQLNGGLREEEGLVEDGLLKVDSVQPLQGAKKRKSGCVRRFKQDAVPPQGSGDGKGEKLGGEDVDSTEDDNAERQKVEDDGKPPHIAKLLRAVEFQASVTNNVQQVSIKFKALRSDGQEVLVDDKELKVKNPLLLISFYEQHLRYSPPTCDVNEQQS